MEKTKIGITVKELRDQLKMYDDNLELFFGGLDFYRLKDRGGCVQVEFDQTVYLNDQGLVVVENH
jgi:tRNA A37 threonylcarbamoyladenosine biosynthesis protein TsaE